MKRLTFLFAIFPLFFAENVHAYGSVGDRIFPSTLSIADPIDSDEIALPAISYSRIPDGIKQTDIGGELTKTITSDFALTVQDDYRINANPHHGTEQGFDDIIVGADYQLMRSPEHEFALLAKLDMAIGDSGSQQVGADHFNSYIPAIVFGKGFGDLPDRMPFLKPFAITGAFGYDWPDHSLNSQTFNWGGTLQYSIPYLQQHIMNIGINGIAAGFIPVGELAMKTPTDGNGKTTGTLNAGILWLRNNSEYGLEATYPATHATGTGLGVIAQAHFFVGK